MATATFQYQNREFLFIPNMAVPEDASAACRGFGGELASFLS